MLCSRCASGVCSSALPCASCSASRASSAIRSPSGLLRADSRPAVLPCCSCDMRYTASVTDRAAFSRPPCRPCPVAFVIAPCTVRSAACTWPIACCAVFCASTRASSSYLPRRPRGAFALRPVACSNSTRLKRPGCCSLVCSVGGDCSVWSVCLPISPRRRTASSARSLRRRCLSSSRRASLSFANRSICGSPFYARRPTSPPHGVRIALGGTRTATPDPSIFRRAG